MAGPSAEWLAGMLGPMSVFDQGRIESESVLRRSEVVDGMGVCEVCCFVKVAS